MNIRKKGKIYWRLNMTYQTEDERKGQRRQFRTTHLNDHDLKSKIWHPDPGGRVWIDDRRSEQERRAPEGSP